ncbi:MAG: hypothetical protein OHK0013_18150 [Sandaracinaceae bacterium]
MFVPMSFDVQLAMAVCAAIGAVLRRRPNMLIMSANHIIVLRAFQNLEAHGQPSAYFYLPEWLFAPQLLASASEIVAVPSILLLLGAWVPFSLPARTEPLVRVPPAALWVVAAYFTFLFFSTRTVFQTRYASSDQVVFGASAGGGIYVLAWALVLFELRRRVDAAELTPSRALMTVLAMVTLLDFIKGSTGLASGILLTAGFLVFIPGLLNEGRHDGSPPPSVKKILRAGGLAMVLLGAVAASVMFVRIVRTSVASEGFGAAASAAVDQMVALAEGGSDEGLEAAANGTQGAAHILMCVALYDNGVSREWRSIWGPIEYTFKPSVLLRPLGLERSKEAAWELGDYFIHGGGINTFGEFYWNGGWFCLIVMSIVTIGFLWMVDVKARTSWFWLALACAIAPGLVQGYGYGFAQVFRGVANGLVFLVPFIAYLRWVEERNRQPGLAMIRSDRSPRPLVR